MVFWFFLFFIVFKPTSTYSQNWSSDFGNMFLSVSPRILENGSITDISLGYHYTEKYFGELHFRFFNQDKNEEFDIEGVKDSLNLHSEKNIDVFLLPLERFFLKTQTTRLKVGIGIYYNYNTLIEKGYFNMPLLETLGKERVNSYTNDFSMHTLGLLFDAGFANYTKYLEISGNAGIVPFFYFFSKQKMGMIPLLDPYFAEYSQNNFGSPYIYTDLNIVLLKYFSINFFYEFSRLEYKVIDFDDDLKWYNPSQIVYSNTFKCETSLLIPIMQLSRLS